MQFISSVSPQPYLPETVQVSLNVLGLNAMMAQEGITLDEALVGSASDCIQDFIQQVGRFHQEPVTTSHVVPQINTEQIAAALRAIYERDSKR